jgi:hypothetical protein
MNIEKEILAEIRGLEEMRIVQYLSKNLGLTQEQVKALLIRYAYNRCCMTDDACGIDEIADLLKRKYLEE